jgi:hypothetical protein
LSSSFFVVYARKLVRAMEQLMRMANLHPNAAQVKRPGGPLQPPPGHRKQRRQGKSGPGKSLIYGDGGCCSGMLCSAKYTAGEVSVLRAKGGPANSAYERKAWVQPRLQQTIKGNGKRGGKFFLDRPDLLRTPGYLSPASFTHERHGNQVCSRFFTWATGTSNQFIASVWDEPRPRVSNRRAEDTKETRVLNWLTDLGRMYQQQPDSDIVILPFVDRATVHKVRRDRRNHTQRGAPSQKQPPPPSPAAPQLYASDCKDRGTKCCSATYFNKVWRQNPSSFLLKLRRHLRFAKCSTCVFFREKRAELHDPLAVSVLQDMVRSHHLEVKQERLAYYLRRDLAKNFPKKYLSLIIDGADQSKFELPYLKEMDHHTQGMYGIHVYLLGVLAHGRTPMACTYLPNVKQGTNVTTDTLHNYLMHLLKTEGKLPPTLMLQLDNTSKQCKSKYLFGFLGLLVHIGVFEECVVSFLPVGHVSAWCHRACAPVLLWPSGLNNPTPTNPHHTPPALHRPTKTSTNTFRAWRCTLATTTRFRALPWVAPSLPLTPPTSVSGPSSCTVTTRPTCPITSRTTSTTSPSTAELKTSTPIASSVSSSGHPRLVT